MVAFYKLVLLIQNGGGKILDSDSLLSHTSSTVSNCGSRQCPDILCPCKETLGVFQEKAAAQLWRPSLFGSDALIWTPGDARWYNRMLSWHSDARLCQSVYLILLKGIRRRFIQGVITHLMTHSQVCVGDAVLDSCDLIGNPAADGRVCGWWRSSAGCIFRAGM